MLGGASLPRRCRPWRCWGGLPRGKEALPRAFIWSFFTTPTGIAHLEGQPDLLASHFGIGQEGLLAKAVTDPHAAVAVDVATLKAIPALPDDWLVSGLVYEVTTGLVEVVVPPAPLASPESHE